MKKTTSMQIPENTEISSSIVTDLERTIERKEYPKHQEKCACDLCRDGRY